MGDASLKKDKSIKILFLEGSISTVLVDWLRNQGEDAIYTTEAIDLDFVKDVSPDVIVSYNYTYQLPMEIIELPSLGAINLHISFLPWNRGAHPNIWSFLDDTPKGVTIHNMDKGIDTGSIVCQREVSINEDKETLKTSYEILHREIQSLFKENWVKIKTGKIVATPQAGEGSLHYKWEQSKFEPFIKNHLWETPIKELLMKHRAVIAETA